MSRRAMDECAWCAESFTEETMIIGRDWKVYCSLSCLAAGEARSRQEQERWWSAS
jgi:hypothetical protein